MKNLRALRKARGLTQVELCKKLNLAQPTLWGYETGAHEPDIETIRKIAEFFEVSVDYLLGQEESVPITNADRAAGWSDTANVQVSPIEYDMLQVFRKIGEKYGRQTQETAMSMLESMLGLK